MLRTITYSMMVGILLILSGFISDTEQQSLNQDKNQKQVEYEDGNGLNNPQVLTVILERVYLDGEVSEEIMEETIWAMEDFLAQYENWQLIYQDEEQVVFQQHVDDISPLLKSNGYFGISDEGVLTIFDGRPNSSNKVIQSFFQIDIERLESRQHDLLKKGIKVGNKAEYINVLETYRTFTSSP
ncbi:intercompartmental signaling factor BofC [Litchfieldia salsa]|uniref:Forespore regulator of the sigma-K checkpoint n=1 Tax=Litchfieldia salsa TaxID=930152 RepID=A0A1H0V4M5_9BACI|nr:intercompartmental signaling factor BofC [Litchfieldia salsa]SDP73482.1 forespore regulator of the sigma-K checkpoint [Litchfieldia salsa]